MTFEEFYDSALADIRIGGLTWGQAFMRALNKHLPELVDQVKADPNVHPATSADSLAAFLYLVHQRLRERAAATT